MFFLPQLPSIQIGSTQSPIGGCTLITSAPCSARNRPQLGPATTCVSSTTRTPSSGRCFAFPRSRFFSEPDPSKSMIGRLSTSAPTGCAAHSSGVRTMPSGSLLAIASSSSSWAVFFSTAPWIPWTVFTQLRWTSRRSRRCGCRPIIVTNRPSFARYVPLSGFTPHLSMIVL